MFGLGFWEITAILVVALLILGPKKLPQVARTIGKGIRELRGATDTFTNNIERESRKPDPYDEPADVVTDPPKKIESAANEEAKPVDEKKPEEAADSQSAS